MSKIVKNGIEYSVGKDDYYTDGILLSSSDNLNNILTPGRYKWSGVSEPLNKPHPSPANSVMEVKASASDGVDITLYQIVYSASAVYSRRKYDGVWRGGAGSYGGSSSNAWTVISNAYGGYITTESFNNAIAVAFYDRAVNILFGSYNKLTSQMTKGTEYKYNLSYSVPTYYAGFTTYDHTAQILYYGRLTLYTDNSQPKISIIPGVTIPAGNFIFGQPIWILR